MDTKLHLPAMRLRLDEIPAAIENLDAKRAENEAAAEAAIAKLNAERDRLIAERKRLNALFHPLNVLRSDRERLLSSIANVEKHRETFIAQAAGQAAELETLLGAALLTDDGAQEAQRSLDNNPRLSAPSVLIARSDRLLATLRAEVPVIDEKISTLSAQTV